MQEMRDTKLTNNQTVCPHFQQHMDVLEEQHYTIKFCVCLKKNTVEAILLLQEGFGNEVLGVSMFKR